jgi:hypothetical protein
MHTQEETTNVRKLKKGIKAVRKRLPNPAEVKTASREFFFGVSGDRFTSKMRFKTDLGTISKSGKNKMSEILGQHDQEFMQLFELEDEENVYTDPRIIEDRLGRGVRITLEFEMSKVRRNITVDADEDDEEEENEDYKKLHEKLKAIEAKYKKPADEIADVFVKVSGDIVSVERYFQGESVVTWQYLEDLAMTKPEDSMEYRCLVDTKGKAEIEKRRNFLLRSEQQNDTAY